MRCKIAQKVTPVFTINSASLSGILCRGGSGLRLLVNQLFHCPFLGFCSYARLSRFSHKGENRFGGYEFAFVKVVLKKKGLPYPDSVNLIEKEISKAVVNGFVFVKHSLLYLVCLRSVNHVGAKIDNLFANGALCSGWNVGVNFSELNTYNDIIALV